MINEIVNDFNKAIFVDNRYKFILEGIKNTLIISLISVIIGALIGTIIAIINSYNKETKKIKILSKVCKLYVSIIRGTPVLLQLMIIYYVVFRDVRNANLIIIASLAFGINSGAYVSEIIRAGIESIDKGQMEAGRSLGLSYFQTLKLVILPQAIKNILPAVGNEFVTLIKETSVAGYIGVRDLTKASDIIASRTYDYFFPLIIAALIYLIIILGVTKILDIFERRLKKNAWNKENI